MTDSLTSCTLSAADYDAIRSVWEAAGLRIRPAGRDTREALAAQMTSGCVRVIGLADGARVVAVALLSTDSRRGWINRLAVHPDYQRRGLALRLIREGEAALAEMGAYIFAVHIETWNDPSLALFARAGYHHHDDIVYCSKRDSQDL
ncbi:MAG: GNAT family N-acetyltransferase [Anaerolineae bacterium]|nr:GNAT family N-acetyltransferase [Anaerolineae bacterium]